MYSYFEGKLHEKTPTYAIIDCNGVGYMINISLHTFTKIKDEVRDFCSEEFFQDTLARQRKTARIEVFLP